MYVYIWIDDRRDREIDQYIDGWMDGGREGDRCRSIRKERENENFRVLSVKGT